jgi:hypothetical protein
VIFGSIGALGHVPGVRWFCIAATALLGIRAFRWHVRRPRRFSLDRRTVQARRGLAGYGLGGTAYFGWILGATLFTQMTTPVVQALAALSAVGGIQFGLATGAGLGLARSLEPWRGALARIVPLPATIVERYANGATGVSFRLAGIVLAALVLSGDMYCALWR